MRGASVGTDGAGASRGWANSDSLVTVPDFRAEHGFTTRIGGASSGPYASLNLSEAVGDSSANVTRNRERLARSLGIRPAAFALLEQVHGARVVEAGSSDESAADAQVSNDPDHVLVISTADCLPILLFDPVSGAVGAAHAGWRGSVANVVGETVREMALRYGSRAERLEAAIGPGICGNCYQVGEEVKEAVRGLGLAEEPYRPDDEGRWRLDLAALNRQLLLRSGLAAESIHLVRECTACLPERYFSYRRDGGTTGRQWSLIRARGRRDA